MTNTQATPTAIRLTQDGKSLTTNDLQVGDVLLYCPAKPAVHQRRISEETDSPYTHAAIYLGNEQVAEALTRGGVQKNELGSLLAGAGHVGVLRSQAGFGPERVTQLNEFIDTVVSNARWYDFKGALTWKHTNKDFLSTQLDDIARRYGEFKTNEEIAKSAFFCSALIVACFMAVGIIGRSAQVAYPPAAVAPAGLYGDPTFGWAVGYLVPEGSSVPENDPLCSIAQWADMKD